MAGLIEVDQAVAWLWHEKRKVAFLEAALDAVLTMHPEARPAAEKILEHCGGLNYAKPANNHINESAQK